jgi:hypothetical protein
MRLWRIHPSYLDSKGLVALWREGLGAQKALVYLEEGKKCGYQNHPQLNDFKKGSRSIDFMSRYLTAVYYNSIVRGYSFDSNKIKYPFQSYQHDLTVTKGQLRYEFDHLLNKLKTRDPERYKQLKDTTDIKPHPLFSVIEGGIADWEIIK